MGHDRRGIVQAANDRPPGAVADEGSGTGSLDYVSGVDEASEIDEVDAIQLAWEHEHPGTPTGSIGIITRIWRIAKLFSDERRRTLACVGIDAATLDLLSTLRRVGPPYRLTAGGIAERAQVSAGAISQRVARAEREGLITRDRSAKDGRLSHVTLTDEGHALIERSVDDLLRHEETLLKALTAAQRTDLTALLRVMLDDLTSRQRALPTVLAPAISLAPLARWGRRSAWSACGCGYCAG